jgi:antitoxin component YwqK of YwqJK toxin-antitoxin module
MLRYSLFVFFCSLMLAGFAQVNKRYYYDKDRKPSTIQEASYYRDISYDAGGKPAGRVRDYYIGGQKQWEGHLSTDKPVEIKEDTCTWYYRNGQISKKAFFIRDKTQGPFVSFYENGQVKERYNYVNGKQHGSQVSFYQNGNIYQKYNCTDGVLDGERVEYFEDGNQIRQHGLYVNGKPDGKHVYYHSPGVLYKTEYYKDSLPVDTWLEYNEDGKLQMQQSFSDGLAEGKKLEYDRKGQLYSEEQYHKGRLDGIAYYCSADGKTILQKTYRNGREEGEALFYYPSGLINKRVMYQHGSRVSEAEYSETGALEKVCRYPDTGEITCIYYFPDGKKKGEECVRGGSLYTSAWYDENGRLLNEQVPDTVLIHPAKDNINCLYGFKNHKNEWVIKPQYTYYTVCGNYFLTDGKGVIDYQGKTILPSVYDQVRPGQVCDKSYRKREQGFFIFYHEQEPVFVVSKDNHWGIVNIRNEIILPIEYDEIEDTGDSVKIIKKGNLYGLADAQGLLLKPTYPFLQRSMAAGYFTFSKAEIQKDSVRISHTGLINTNGKVLIPTIFANFLFPYNSNLILATRDSIVSLYDLNGKLIIAAVRTKPGRAYEDFFNSRGVAAISKNGKWGVINQNGQLILPLKYDSVAIIDSYQSDKENTLAATAVRKGKWTGVRKDGGKTKVEYQSMLPVLLAGQEGYDSFYRFGVLAGRNGKYGVADDKDSVWVPFVYDTASIAYSEKMGQNVIWLTRNNETRVYSTLDLHTPLAPEDVETILPPDLASFVTPMPEIESGEIPVVTTSHKVGLYDLQKNKFILDTIYDAAAFPGEIMNLGWVKNFQSHETDEGEGDQSFSDAGSETFIKGGWHLVDFEKDTVYSGEFDYPAKMEDSVFVVYQNGLAGLLNVTGTLLIPCEYSEIEKRRNIYYLHQEEKLGLSDAAGHVLVESVYTRLSGFLRGYSLFEKDEKWGVIDINGNEIIPASAKEPGQLESGLKELGLDEDDLSQLAIYNSINQAPVSVSYSNMELLDEYFHRHTDLRRKNLLHKQIENLAEENKGDGDYGTYCSHPGWITFAEEENPLHLVYDAGKWGEIDFENFCSSHTKEIEVSILGIGKNYLSCSLISTNNYTASRGMGTSQTSVNFYTWQIVSGDSLRILSLYDLVEEGEATDRKLNSLLITAIQKLENVELDCSNPEAYLSMVSERFALTDEGLTFYLYNEHDLNFYNPEAEIALFIPYAELKPIINKKGILADK